MVPTAFDEDNAVVDHPIGLGGIMEPLSVHRGVSKTGGPLIVSCWRPTPEEWAEMNRTGRVWLMVIGDTMPGVGLSGKYPFERV